MRDSIKRSKAKYYHGGVDLALQIPTLLLQV